MSVYLVKYYDHCAGIYTSKKLLVEDLERWKSIKRPNTDKWNLYPNDCYYVEVVTIEERQSDMMYSTELDIGINPAIPTKIYNVEEFLAKVKNETS